jgi:hypothetical protein
MWIVSKLPYPWKLRVHSEAETGVGLDLYEHGASAYATQE